MKFLEKSKNIKNRSWNVILTEPLSTKQALEKAEETHTILITKRNHSIMDQFFDDANKVRFLAGSCGCAVSHYAFSKNKILLLESQQEQVICNSNMQGGGVLPPKLGREKLNKEGP